MIEIKLRVDYDRCTGLGVCESLAQDVFRVEDDGTMRIIDDHPSDDRRDVMADVVSSCPTQAISIED